MYTTFVPLVAFFILRILACNPGTPGCDHPGNFTGALTAFPDPAKAHCGPGNQTAFFANVPAAFYNPPDESPCDAPINITHPTTKKTITAMVIGDCKPCKGHNIELTHAGLMALSPSKSSAHTANASMARAWDRAETDDERRREDKQGAVEGQVEFCDCGY